jgi:hypothetical protein
MMGIQAAQGRRFEYGGALQAWWPAICKQEVQVFDSPGDSLRGDSNRWGRGEGLERPPPARPPAA